MKLKLGVVVAVTATVGFLTVGTAFAGGWAVTIIDKVPATFVAGETYEIGYTILQHGRTPANVDGTAILTQSASGTADRFPGKRDGSPGHYVASVRFPGSGTFTWAVDQGGFAEQDLGPVEVVEPVAAGSSSSASPNASTSTETATVETSTPTALRAALLLTALAALGMFAVQAGAWFSRRRVVEA